MTTTRASKITARSITELCGKLSDEWYDAVEGIYSDNVPTWGPETETVREQIGRSCDEGDIVSWDTRPADVNKHRYLLRRWTPALKSQPNGSEHEFFVLTHVEYLERE